MESDCLKDVEHELWSVLSQQKDQNPYWMTQLSTKSVAAFVEITAVTGRTLTNISYRSVKKTTC